MSCQRFRVLKLLRALGELLNDASSLLESGGLAYLTTPNLSALQHCLGRNCFAPISSTTSQHFRSANLS